MDSDISCDSIEYIFKHYKHLDKANLVLEALKAEKEYERLKGSVNILYTKHLNAVGNFIQCCCQSTCTDSMMCYEGSEIEEGISKIKETVKVYILYILTLY